MSDEGSEAPEERRGRYVRWAAKANDSAAKTSSEDSQRAFRDVAKAWQSMAERIRTKRKRPSL